MKKNNFTPDHSQAFVGNTEHQKHIHRLAQSSQRTLTLCQNKLKSWQRHC